MARCRQRDLGKERFWRRVVRRWRRSQLSVRDFCSAERLAEPSFYSWRRILAERDREVRPPAQRRGRSRQRDRSPTRGPASLGAPGFLPVQVVTTAAIEIVLGNGRVIRLGDGGFDPAALRQLLAVVEAPSC